MSSRKVYPIHLGLAALFFMFGLVSACDAEGTITYEPTTTAFPATATPISPGEDISADRLEGIQWRLISYIDRKGNQFKVLSDTDISILFNLGQISGSAGCNQYSATYQLDGQDLALQDAGVTERFCMAPEGIMDQEYAYLNALGSVASYRLADGRLQLLDSQGQTLLIFRQ